MNPTKTEYTELVQLLRESAAPLPEQSDLDKVFLSDLHKKIRADQMQKSSLSLLRERFLMQFQELISPSMAWGGSVFATVLLALGLGVFFSNKVAMQDLTVEASTQQSPQGTLRAVKAGQLIDLQGSVPVFLVAPEEF